MKKVSRVYSHLGSVSMALFSAGSSPTFDLAYYVLNVITTSLPCVLPLVIVPRLCSRPFTLHHVH